MPNQSASPAIEPGEPSRRRHLVAVLLCCLPLLAIGSGSLPLHDPDESRFARTSVEMLRSGDPVVPTFEGRPRLVKPPLLHWLQAALFGTFGIHEFLARLPALLATLGSICLVGWVVTRRFGAAAAPWAAIILGTCPLVVAIGRIGTLDALLAVHVLAVVALDMVGGEPRRSTSLVQGALLGMAFLIKGPVGVILPLLILLVGRTAARRELLRSPGNALLSAAAATAVILPWGLAFAGRIGWSGTSTTLREEVLSRYLVGGDHLEPAWYYLGVIAVGFLPWVAPLVTGLIRAVVRFRDPGSRTAIYSAAGLLAGVLFFSMGRSKMPTYLLPLAPLVAILVTWELGRQAECPEDRRGPGILVGACALLAVILGWSAITREVPAQRWVASVGALAYAVATLVGGVGWVRRRPLQVFSGAAGAAWSFLFAASILLAPAIGERRSARALVDAVPELRTAETVIRVDMQLPSLTFYLDRVPEEVALDDLAMRKIDAGSTLFVFDHGDLGRLREQSSLALEPVGSAGKYVVLRRIPEVSR